MDNKTKALKKKSNAANIMTRLLKNKIATLGLIIFCAEILIAVFAPLIMPYGYADINPVNRFIAPCFAHPCGTDGMGRDMLSRILYGSRYSLTIAITSQILATGIGMAIGAIAGYFGGKTDNTIMRFLDVIQAIPAMLLSIVISAVLGAGPMVTVIAIGVGDIAGKARLFRATILNIRNQDYIEASRAIGQPTYKVILSHIVPNGLSPMIVSITIGFAQAVISTAALSFVGLGVQPPLPEWGALLSGGRDNMRLYPFLVIFPGIAIMLTAFALNVLGDGLRDAMDPKLKD